MARPHHPQKPMTREQFRDRLPAIEAASRRLQNATGVRNTDTWPTPTKPETDVNLSVFAVNVMTLEDALLDCADFCVNMDRRSERGELLDITVGGFEKRKVVKEWEGAQIGNTKQNHQSMNPTGKTTSTKEALDGDGVAHTLLRDGISGVGLQTNPFRLPNLTTGKMDIGSNESYPPCTIQRFPDPHQMIGSFTNAICQYEDFSARPVLALTLKDVSPPMSHSSVERCILLKHFEVGLDGVESIATGEVIIPESPLWRKNVREARLGKLGTLRTGRGGHSRDLEAHQRRCHYGEGKWIFFGIKFKQSYEEMKIGRGKWCCFGAPIEATQSFEAVEEEITVGGGQNIVDQNVSTCPARFLRTTLKLSAGGVPCMDLWEKAGEWDDGLWGDVLRAASDNCLLIDALYQTREQKETMSLRSVSNTQPPCEKGSIAGEPGTGSSSPADRMDGPTDTQSKRKREPDPDDGTPRKGTDRKRTWSR